MIPLLLALVTLSQNPGPPPIPLPPTPLPATAPFFGADGQPLVRGALPKDASEEARKLWARVLAATLVPGEVRQPITGFDLVLDARVKGSANQTNDTSTALRYRFAAPDRLRAATAKGRELVRGPKGEFLIDATREDPRERATELIGRESAEDRRQLREALDLSRNFVALADPSLLRMASLVLAKVEIELVPHSLRDRAAELDWLELTTPDFHLPESAAPLSTLPSALVRVHLGIDRQTALPELCLVQRAGSKSATALFEANLIALSKPKALDGLNVPTTIAVYEAGGPEAKAFNDYASTTIFLYPSKSSLRPVFKDEDFLP